MRTFQLIKISLLIVTLFFTVVSCKNDNNEEPITPPESFIEDFNQTNMSFSEEAGEQTFSFTANGDWTVDVASTSGGNVWCKASPTEGKAGSQTVKITTTENDTYDDRSVTVTLKSGDESKTFVVTQKQKDAILINSNKIEVEQKGGTITIEVKANVDYTATIGETCKDWITESSNTRALSSTEETYSIALNEHGEKREGTITFTNGTLSETVHIYQAGGDIILLSKNEYYVDAAGEDITVELRSNCEYEVEMPAVDWIHTTSSRSMSSHTLYYTIDTNETYDSREAKIIYRNKGKNIADTLTIIQAQKDAIILGKKEVTVGADGEIIEVKLSANVEYEVEMPNVDWITTTTTRGLTEHTLYYNVTKNEGDDSRSAKITFTNKESGVEDILLVSQKGKMPDIITINVPNAGDLPKITERTDFKALKLVGYLNGTDISAIRKMRYLEYLDISEAHIVSGGSMYQADYGKFGTEDNRIGYYMFFELEHLKQILLPNSITAIELAAFLGCTNLSIIEIPDSVTMIGNGAFSGCANLKNINIPNGVTAIGSAAFSGCKSLTNINIPDGVTTIQNNTFNNCTSLTNIDIPNSVTTIGEWAFAACTSFTSIDIPNSVTTIEEYAFEGCHNVSIVKIGTGVKSIYNAGLFDYDSIKEVYCYTTIPPKSQKDDFSGIIKSKAKLYVPKGTYQAYYWSNWGAAFDNIIEMED